MKVTVIWALALVLQGLGAVTLAQELFTADVLMERSTVDESGRTVSAAAPIRFRLAESVRSGIPVISLTYLPAPGRPPTGPAADPLSGMRVELDEEGREVRIFDSNGRQIGIDPSGAPPAPVRIGAMRSAHRGPIVSSAHGPERLRELRNDLGLPVGKVRDFDRYVKNNGNDTVEVLVLMPSAVVTEVNIVRGGAMESHATFEYERLADGSLLQRVARTETRIPDRPGERSVVQMTYSNVTSEKAR
jgi:hypothetical protein